MDVFPREQIKIILFDDFKANTEKIYFEVLNFLGVEPNFAPQMIDHNPNTEMKFQFLARMIQDPKHPITATVKTVFPRRIWKKAKEIGLKINTRVVERKAINPETKKALKKEFHSEVLKLQELLHSNDFLERTRSLEEEWNYSTLD